MDLRGYTTVDEVGEDSQVRNFEDFRPSTAAEEIEYLNKILENMENYDSKENSKSEIPRLENAFIENDPHSNDTYNNNALDLITEVCSETMNVELGKNVCEQNFLRDEGIEKLEQLSDRCTIKEILENQKSDCNEVDVKEYGLPCADDILTQAKNQHSVIQDTKSGYVQNELSTDPNLIMADPAIPDVEDNFRQSPDCTQSNFSPKAELEDKLEAHSIEPASSDAPNETGSSELSSSTKEATIMPVNCSAESSSVLESRHYSAKETFDFISGEDVSESSTLDSLELGDVSLSNVVLGDIGSLLESSIDQPNETDENTPTEYETQIDLSIVKSEPVCTDPGEDFDLKDFCSDPGEEFVLKENSIKEEPLESPPPARTMNQEEVLLLPVKIFKSEDDGSDEQVVMPNIRYLVDENKEYSREEVAAALIMSQSSLSPIIDMDMFQNLGRTKLAVSSSRLEDMLKRPKRLTLEDFNVVQLFRGNYGSSLNEWKAFFKLRGNYSVKHTARKVVWKPTDIAPTEKRKGKRGRKKKCETEVSNGDASMKEGKVKNEGKDCGDHEPNKMCSETTKASSLKEEESLKEGISEKNSFMNEVSSKVKETVTPNAKKGRRGRKKKCLMEKSDSDSKCSTFTIEDVQVDNESAKEKEPRSSALNQVSDESTHSMPIKEEAVLLKEGMDEYKCILNWEPELKVVANEDVSHEKKRKSSLDQTDETEVRTKLVNLKNENVTLNSEHSENKIETVGTSQQLNLSCKACYVCLYDIAKDATYGMIVRSYLKENNENKALGHRIELPMKVNSTECKIPPPPNLFSDDSSEEAFTGFSPVKQREKSFNKNEEDVVPHEGKEDSLKETEHIAVSRRNKAKEKSQLDIVVMEKKDEPNQSVSGEDIEIGTKHRKKVETEVNLTKETMGGDMKKEEDTKNDKDRKRERKRLKLECEDLDERSSCSMDRKKSISEQYISIGVSEENQEEEENDIKSEDSSKNDGAQGVLYAKKIWEEVLPTKDRSSASSLPTLATFRIPKKKATHIGEPKTQEQNSVLLRRGESSATPKSEGYFSKKQYKAQNRKVDFREKERHNARNIKNETKSTIPVQQPVVEGWAKRAPPPFGGYHPQSAVHNMPIRNMSPATGTHPGPGNNKVQIEATVNQHRMQLSYNERAHIATKTDHSNLPCSQFRAASTGNPMRQVNVPPPPPLEKMYHHSSSLKHGNGNIKTTPYESSPVMSCGNSSDGESDIAETGKTSSCNTQQARVPLTGVTGSSFIDVTKTYKANLCNTQVPQTSLTGSPNIEVTEANKTRVTSVQPPDTSNISITETCKANTNSAQSSHNNSTATHDITTTIKVTDTISEELLHVKETHSEESTLHNVESSKDKVEAREGTSKDHYHNLDKRQKIKLYEKRKRYYQESRKKYYAEKGDKKHFWLKEYEKRKKEYYHLKIYLYKEKKREQMANKIHKERQDTHGTSDGKTSARVTVISEPCAGPELLGQREARCNTAVEAEEIPYSPTGSPVDFDDIDFTRSLLDDAPKKLPTDKKEQEVTLNCSTDKLKEMLMLVMNTLNQQSSNVKPVFESQSGQTGAKSKEAESTQDENEFHSSESSPPFSSPLTTSESFLSLNTTESFLSATSSMPSPLKQMVLPSVPSSPSLDKTPVPVPPPPLSVSQITSLVSSRILPKDSLAAPLSAACTPLLPVPPPHPVPVSSTTFSLTSTKKAVHDHSGNKGSCPDSEDRVELPVASPSRSSLGERYHSEILKDITLPPFLSLPVPPLPGQELTREMSRFFEDSSLPSVTLRDEVLPPLPPSPQHPLPVEECVEKASESYNVGNSRLEEISATDDMTEVPMDIDSDEDRSNETSYCHDNHQNRAKTSAYQDNKGDENIKTFDCLNNNGSAKETGNSTDTEAPEVHESDSDFLALFGVYEDNSPVYRKGSDGNSTGDQQMTKLLRKLMNVTSVIKPFSDQQGDECRLDAKSKEIDAPLVLERPRSGVNPISHNKNEIGDYMSRKVNTLPVINVNDGKEVSIVPDKNTLGKTTKEQEAEVTSLPSCSKENRKGKSLNEAKGASCKSEIEIIASKEPPKNLICVDEILLSVEAADQPTDLEIIYADLRKTPREKPKIIRDEVPKYYQKTALAQTLVDKCKDIHLVGLQYVLEVRKDVNMTLDGCYYICAVCSKKMTANTLIAHIKSVPHRLKFSETHCKNIFDKYGSYELKEWTATLVKAFTMDLAEVGKKMGKHKLAVAFEREMSSVLKSLKQKLCEIGSLSQVQEEKTKVSEAPTPSKPSEPATVTASSIKDVQLTSTAKPKDVGVSAAPNANIPLSPKSSKPKSPGPKNGNTNKDNDGFDDNEDDDVLILPPEKKIANAKKFSSNGQGFTKRNYRPGPNARHQSSSRSSTPSLSPRKTRSRSNSRSLSPKRAPVHSPPNKLRRCSKSPPSRKPDRRSPQRHSLDRQSSLRHSHLPGRKRRHSRSPISPHHSRSRSRSRDIQKQCRSRRRSRSRHRSPPYRKKEGWSHRSPPTKRDNIEEMKRRAARRRVEDFRDAEMKIKARHKNELIVYEKAPESHPLYNREWKVFWERRCREMEKEGLDPFLYDFKREWAVFWHHRMKELMEKTFKSKRDGLLRKFRLEESDLEENKVYGGNKPPGSSWKKDNDGVEKVSRIDRSPSPWEEDGAPAIARNPSPKPGGIGNTAERKDSSKSTEIPATKFEDDFSVIGTLKLLNELEDQLGSFGPAITTLLGKAVDCGQKGEDTLDLFKDPDNLVLVRYAREKLSSQITAGILGVAALVKTQMAVERSMWLQSQAEKLANEGKYLGLDITGIARATLGRDTVQIAQYIAQHLLQVGKSNASESDLQNILYAVLAAHTKLLVETSKQAQADTPVIEGAAPVSAPHMPDAKDSSKELPNAPNATPEGTKQPLFPSTLPSNSGGGDKNVKQGDKDSSDKVVGGLGMLQSAYEEENGKDMENLSLDDLRSLLSNFSSLSTEEKQALTTYLKKLEATDSKKVMKLREEIQKSARNASKTSSVKSASKPGKSGTRPQGTPHTGPNSRLGQEQASETPQMLTPEEKVPLTQVGESRDIRPHSKDSASQPPVAPPRENFMDESRRDDVMHDSRGNAGPSGGLDLPTHNVPPAALSGPPCTMHPSSLDSSSSSMPPAPGRMGEMAQDFGPSIGHKPDYMDQPMFDSGRNHPFPQGTFMDRQEPGPGISNMKQDRSYDHFGYEPLPGQDIPMGPDGPSRFDRPEDARFDRLGKGKFERPGEPRFDGPGEHRLDRPGEPKFDGPGEPRFGGPGEPRFGGPGEPRFGGPGEQRFVGHGEPRFDGPGEPRFDGPGGSRFDRPGEARFDGLGEPKFDRPGEQRFGGPEPRFGGPGEPRFDKTVKSRFDGPGEPRFNRPGEPIFDGPREPGFNRPGESRFGRPGESYNPQWQGFGRGGPQMDDSGFPHQGERHYQWFDDGPQGPNESRDFGPRGRAGLSFRGGPRRGVHPNTRQPYREPW